MGVVGGGEDFEILKCSRIEEECVGVVVFLKIV